MGCSKREASVEGVWDVVKLWYLQNDYGLYKRFGPYRSYISYNTGAVPVEGVGIESRYFH